MFAKEHIKLFYWSSVIFEKRAEENYGDLLSKYIVEKLSGKEVRYYNAPKSRKKWFKSEFLMAIGSIMSYATDKAKVWGSGIISKQDQFGPATFYAVRGPKSRERVLELGYACPEVYGDPALLLPSFYKPERIITHDLGIIPHYVDYPTVKAAYAAYPEIKVIDLLGSDVEGITNEILSCGRTISSSLHGLIVSHAYGVPSVWVKYSDKLTGDNVKFEDYLLSVGLEPYQAILVDDFSKELLEAQFEGKAGKPENNTIAAIQKGLVASFPYR